MPPLAGYAPPSSRELGAIDAPFKNEGQTKVSRHTLTLDCRFDPVAASDAGQFNPDALGNSDGKLVKELACTRLVVRGCGRCGEFVCLVFPPSAAFTSSTNRCSIRTVHGATLIPPPHSLTPATAVSAPPALPLRYPILSLEPSLITLLANLSMLLWNRSGIPVPVPPTSTSAIPTRLNTRQKSTFPPTTASTRASGHLVTSETLEGKAAVYRANIATASEEPIALLPDTNRR